MARNLHAHLSRCSAARCIPGVQRTTQAEHCVHVFLDLWIELLQHRQFFRKKIAGGQRRAIETAVDDDRLLAKILRQIAPQAK